jgi:hypothetical protein
MTEDELKRALAAAFERGDRRWITPSGAILDVLRDFVGDGKIDEAAEAYRLYISLHPIAARFIAGALPAILVNWYKPILKAADFETFLEWTTANPDWAEKISSNPANLSTIVGDMIKSLEAFSNTPL